MPIDALLEPLKYEFFQRALIEVLLIATLTALVGSFVVVRNLAFITEAISHGVFPGVVISYLVKVDILLGAIVTGIISVLGIAAITKNRSISENNAIGIILATLFAIGVALISTLSNFKTNLSNLLVGDILGVSWTDIGVTIFALISLLILFKLFFKSLHIVAFDSEYARSVGIHVNRMDLLLYISIAIVVVVSVQLVGTLLVVAMTVIPATTARISSKNLSEIVIKAITGSICFSIIGLFLSYYFEIAASASIVLVNAGVLYLTLGIKGLKRG